jgi:hypothetical protein
MHFKRKIAIILFQIFLAVVNGGKDVDARKIYTQFLMPMSWAKTNIFFFSISRFLIREYVQEEFLEDNTINGSTLFYSFPFD